jgi:hypothetical protein
VGVGLLILVRVELESAELVRSFHRRGAGEVDDGEVPAWITVGAEGAAHEYTGIRAAVGRHPPTLAAGHTAALFVVGKLGA